MASSTDFKDFVIEQLQDLDEISCRPMMGEFLLYHKGVLFGGIYDDRFLVKPTKSNEKYALQQEIPYEHAKPMCLVENLDDREYLRKLVEETCKDLANKKT